MLTLLMVIFIPFLAAMLIPFLNKLIARLHIGWFVMLIPILLFVLLARYIPNIASGEVFLHTVNWIPTFNLNFTTYLDGLSLIFGLLITGIGALVILYSIYYLSEDESLQHFYIYLLLFMGGMLGVVFSDHMMVLYVFWELTSISSFLLIAFWFHRTGSRYGAKKAMLITVSGGLAMLVGFIMLSTMTGTSSVREVIQVIGQYTDHSLFLPAMVLILLGAFTKSAQFPFHIWLPDAMEAPTPISAYLHSATMVKAGIYLVARFTPVFGGEATWFWLVTGVGLMTLFWGAFSAIKQTDLKALLAYSTVSQLGLIMSLLGMASVSLHTDIPLSTTLYTQAAFAALFHLVNHSTFKGALFMMVGIVDFQVGTRDIRRLGGLVTLMPISFTIALIGSFSMAGLPPFNGFLSKEMFFTAALNIQQLNVFNLETLGAIIPIVAWIASVFTFVYSMIIVFKTFLGKSQDEKVMEDAGEPPFGMLISPIILALFVIGIFFFPNVIGDHLIKPAMASLYPTFDSPESLGQTISIWHGFNTELFMTLAIVLFGIVLYKMLPRWKKIYNLFPERWSLDHLYNRSLTRMESGSRKATRFYMTGSLRHYLIYIYAFFIVMTLGVLFYTGAFAFDLSNDTPVSTFEWILTSIMVIAGILILFARHRLTAILFNGVLGFSIALFFVLFRAPDLALTQIVIETVTTALFLLCFYFLPEWEKEKSDTRTKIINGFISISVGATFVLVALAVHSGKLFETISVFFEDSYELAGGKNIVNTVLGDFRAFDTMLEVTVLFIAGLGVYSLIRMKSKYKTKGANKIED